MLKVSAMRIPLAVTITSIVMLASPLAYGQAASGKGQIGTHGTSGKPSGSAVGGGDRTLVHRRSRASLRQRCAHNLAGGGYADPNYCRLGRTQKKRHGIWRHPRGAGADLAPL